MARLRRDDGRPAGAGEDRKREAPDARDHTSHFIDGRPRRQAWKAPRSFRRRTGQPGSRCRVYGEASFLAVAQHLIVADAIPPPLGGTRNPDLPGPACDGLRRPRKALNGVDGVSNDLMAPLGRAAHPVAAQAALYYGGSQVRRKCDSSKIQRRIFTILF